MLTGLRPCMAFHEPRSVPPRRPAVRNGVRRRRYGGSVSCCCAHPAAWVTGLARWSL